MVCWWGREAASELWYKIEMELTLNTRYGSADMYQKYYEELKHTFFRDTFGTQLNNFVFTNGSRNAVPCFPYSDNLVSIVYYV